MAETPERGQNSTGNGLAPEMKTHASCALFGGAAAASVRACGENPAQARMGCSADFRLPAVDGERKGCGGSQSLECSGYFERPVRIARGVRSAQPGPLLRAQLAEVR